MRQRGGNDVTRAVLIVGWLLLAARMKDHLGTPEIIAACTLFAATIVVWFGD